MGFHSGSVLSWAMANRLGRFRKVTIVFIRYNRTQWWNNHQDRAFSLVESGNITPYITSKKYLTSAGNGSHGRSQAHSQRGRKVSAQFSKDLFYPFHLPGANIFSDVVLSAGTAGKQWKAIMNCSAFWLSVPAASWLLNVKTKCTCCMWSA